MTLLLSFSVQNIFPLSQRGTAIVLLTLLAVDLLLVILLISFAISLRKARRSLDRAVELVEGLLYDEEDEEEEPAEEEGQEEETEEEDAPEEAAEEELAEERPAEEEQVPEEEVPYAATEEEQVFAAPAAEEQAVKEEAYKSAEESVLPEEDIDIEKELAQLLAEETLAEQVSQTEGSSPPEETIEEETPTEEVSPIEEMPVEEETTEEALPEETPVLTYDETPIEEETPTEEVSSVDETPIKETSIEEEATETPAPVYEPPVFEKPVDVFEKPVETPAPVYERPAPTPAPAPIEQPKPVVPAPAPAAPVAPAPKPIEPPAPAVPVAPAPTPKPTEQPVPPRKPRRVRPPRYNVSFRGKVLQAGSTVQTLYGEISAELEAYTGVERDENWRKVVYRVGKDPVAALLFDGATLMLTLQVDHSLIADIPGVADVRNKPRLGAPVAVAISSPRSRITARKAIARTMLALGCAKRSVPRRKVSAVPPPTDEELEAQGLARKI